MKALSILIFCCSICTFRLWAQTNNAQMVGISMPAPGGDIDDTRMQLLQNKITQFVNNSNELLIANNNDFVLCPDLVLETTTAAEGGLQNITVTTLDLSLQVKQLSTGMVFNTMSKQIKGSGNNKQQAITNAISNLNLSDPKSTQFLSASKTKILQYYNENCDKLIKKAQLCEGQRDYDQALGILQSIPENANCYNTAGKKVVDVYNKYKSYFCSRIIAMAKAAFAVSDYETTEKLLWLVEPVGDCKAEADHLTSQLAAKIERHQQAAYSLEAMRINAVKEIGKAYFASAGRSGARRGRK